MSLDPDSQMLYVSALCKMYAFELERVRGVLEKHFNYIFRQIKPKTPKEVEEELNKLLRAHLDSVNKERVNERS